MLDPSLHLILCIYDSFLFDSYSSLYVGLAPELEQPVDSLSVAQELDEIFELVLLVWREPAQMLLDNLNPLFMIIHLRN